MPSAQPKTPLSKIGNGPRISNVAEKLSEVFSVEQVFAEPLQLKGLTLVPVARISGGGGGGADGSGLGGRAKPLGALLVRDGEVTWLPTPDVNRIVLAVSGVMALMLVLSIFKRRKITRSNESGQA